jgi:2,5-dihydroxypyridine 5,6-dioxygenase
MLRHHASAGAAGDLARLFAEGLTACGLKPGESLLVYTDTLANPAYGAGFMLAGRALGAEAAQITQSLFAGLEGPPTVGRATPTAMIVAAMKAADLVVDVSTSGMLYSDSQQAILASGTRILRVREPEDCLARLLPNPAVRDRSIRGGRMMETARTLTLATPDDAILRMEKRDRPVHLQYSMADQPGRWDHWPTGMVGGTVIEDTVEGTFVVAPGSLIFPLNRYVEHPVRVTFAAGTIVAIEGGADAIMLRDYLDGAASEGAYKLSHIGWGTDHRARWHVHGARSMEGGGGAEARSIHGGVLIALGENRDLGGAVAAPIHVDIALRRGRLELDGISVVEDGRILREDIA